MIVECLKPAVAPAFYSEVLNQFCGQLILSKQLEVIREYTGILKQEEEQDSWSSWLYGKVSGSCKKAILQTETKRQQNFQVPSQAMEMLLHVSVLDRVCENMMNRDCSSPLMLKSEFKQLIRQNFTTELEVKIFKSYLRKTTHSKSAWLHSYQNLVKISPLPIDELDIAAHKLFTLLEDFQQTLQELEQMELYDWKRTVQHNLTQMVREFLGQHASPAQQLIQKFIMNNSRLQALQLTKELMEQAQSDFFTIQEVQNVLQMEYPQASDIEWLQQLNLV